MYAAEDRRIADGARRLQHVGDIAVIADIKNYPRALVLTEEFIDFPTGKSMNSSVGRARTARAGTEQSEVPGATRSPRCILRGRSLEPVTCGQDAHMSPGSTLISS